MPPLPDAHSASAPRTLLFLLLAGMATLATACAHRGAPSAYPAFDAATAEPSLVVATFVATGELPKFPECGSRDVLCMDPAPTWIKLQALETLYGAAPPRTFFASTTSHYGRIDAYADLKQPMLMLLLSHEGERVMARYSRANLDTDSRRQLHLVLINRGPYWLPCSTRGLREEITDPVLARASRMSRKDYDQFYAKDHADHFRVEGEFAYPRYSLPMANLQAHLAGKTLSTADFGCDASPD